MDSLLSVAKKAVEQGTQIGFNGVVDSSPEVLTNIYTDPINIAVMQRPLSDAVQAYCQALVNDKPCFNLRAVIKSDQAIESLTSLLPRLAYQAEVVSDIDQLMAMYSCLFDLDEVGIRMQVLDRAMCPRFHTDKLACRLVTTYQGPGTEWLYNHDVDRSKLGMGSRGLSDQESGLYPGDDVVKQVQKGDVVLLKGDGWIGNEGLGAVHRSPLVSSEEKRVVVTMDFA